MKPNLINYKIFENEIKNIREITNYNNSQILNVILILILLSILFLIFYVFRDKKTKKNRVKNTLDKLEYIIKRSDEEIDKKNKYYYMYNIEDYYE